jgi:glycosyltransferase involved in cell wall biosynthesis
LSDQHPLVSVVTPTLDRAERLERTLRSVRAQSYPNVEHIVVDGGSTDGTLALLERYAGTYDLRWVSEPDRGMYDAINKGLRMARGEILAYLNSDDLYFPWTVATVIEAFATDPEAGLVFGDVLRDDELRGILVPVFQPPFRLRRMAAHGSFFQPTVFIRRSVFEDAGAFDTDLRYVADLEYWLRATARHTTVQVREFLALESWHAGMLSQTAAEPMTREDRIVRARYRSGLWATRFGPILGKFEWHAWSAAAWWAFVAATHRRGAGWLRSVDALRPTVAASAGIVGALPSKGSQLRSAVRWQVDPGTVATGPRPGGGTDQAA